MYYTRLRLTPAFQNGNKGLIQKEKLVLSRVQHLQIALLQYLARLFGAITAPIEIFAKRFLPLNFHSEGHRFGKNFGATSVGRAEKLMFTTKAPFKMDKVPV